MLIQVPSSFLGCGSERENMATAGAGRLEEGLPSCAAPGAGGHHLCARRAVTGPQDWAACPVHPQGVRSESGHYVCVYCHCSVAKSYQTLCDPVDSSTSSFPVPHRLPKLAKFTSIESVMPSNHPILSCLYPPWTEKRSNQSILKKINPEYSLERLMLKL